MSGERRPTLSSGAGTPPDTCFFWCGNASRSDIAFGCGNTRQAPDTDLRFSPHREKGTLCVRVRSRTGNFLNPTLRAEGAIFSTSKSDLEAEGKKVGQI